MSTHAAAAVHTAKHNIAHGESNSHTRAKHLTRSDKKRHRDTQRHTETHKRHRGNTILTEREKAKKEGKSERSRAPCRRAKYCMRPPLAFSIS